MQRCGITSLFRVTGKVLLQEDPGNSARDAEVWSYDPVAEVLSGNCCNMIQRVLEKRDSGGDVSVHCGQKRSSGIIEVTDLGVRAPKAGERILSVGAAGSSGKTETTDLAGRRTDRVGTSESGSVIGATGAGGLVGDFEARRVHERRCAYLECGRTECRERPERTELRLSSLGFAPRAERSAARPETAGRVNTAAGLC